MALAHLLAGTISGGAVLGLGTATAAFVSSRAPAIRMGVLLGLGLVSVTSTVIPSWRRWVPQRGRQVRAGLMHERNRESAAFLWGVELGTGIRTWVVTPAFYGLMALCLTQPSALRALAICLLYGATRGSVIVTLAEVARRLGSSRPAEWEPGHDLEVKLRGPLALLTCLAVGTGLAAAVGEAPLS